MARRTAFLAGQPSVASEHLARLRGGDDVTDNTVVIDGSVDDNNASNIRSGNNVLDGASFGHASGINTVIQNTGSNVLIQNGMVVTVRFADPVP